MHLFLVLCNENWVDDNLIGARAFVTARLAAPRPLVSLYSMSHSGSLASPRCRVSGSAAGVGNRGPCGGRHGGALASAAVRRRSARLRAGLLPCCNTRSYLSAYDCEERIADRALNAHAFGQDVTIAGARTGTLSGSIRVGERR
jgi:hypothetical protein